MATNIIPTSTALEDSHYRQRIALDGRDYLLRFFFNTREARWYLDIDDQDGVPILSGTKVNVGRDLLSGLVSPRRPPGVLVAVDTQAIDADNQRSPGAQALGARVRLYYIDAEDLGRER